MKLSVFILLTSVMLASIARADMRALQNFATKDFLLSTATTGCYPKGMKIDPQGSYLYLAEMCGKIDPQTQKRVPTASIYDLKTRTLSKTLITPVGIAKDGIFANTEVEFSIDGKWAFISRAEGDQGSEIFKNYGLLSVVDTQTQKIVKYIPTKGAGSKIITARPATAAAPGQQIVYVANYFSDDISVVEVSNLVADGNLDGSKHYVELINLKTNFPNPASRGYHIAPRGIAFTHDGKYALILATETGSIIIVDALKHKQVAELAPLDEATAGRPVNVRHIVITKDGTTAYLSHMRGNAVSRIDVRKLISEVEKLPKPGPEATLPSRVWQDLLIPFQSATGPKKLLILENYPKDHPNFAGKTWPYAHPNTIALDPVQNRYLYVSSRTTTVKDDSRVDQNIKGKIDVIDTKNGQVVFSLVGGAQPTALEVSHDGNMLISSALIDNKLYFYDLQKILQLYNQ